VRLSFLLLLHRLNLHVSRIVLEIGEFHPQDATTNPSLILAAVSKPEYAHIIDGAIQYALSHRNSIETQTQLALDHLVRRWEFMHLRSEVLAFKLR
jgi:transaldolase